MRSTVIGALGFAVLLGSATSARDAYADPALSSSESSYRLGPGDKLRITVFNEPTLTGEYSLTSEGHVSMPLVGDVPASGLSLVDLQRALTERLRTYVKEPRVSVEPTVYRPYFILGEVNKPGQYAFAQGLKIEQAIAAAGGFTYRANRGTIFVRRDGNPQEQRFRMRQELVPVLPGDTIRVGERFF